MVMSAIGSLVIFVIVNRNASILVMMMVVIHANLRNTVSCIVNGPSRYRDAHAKRQPDESEQTQEWTNGVIHNYLIRRCRKNGQSRMMKFDLQRLR